MNKQVYADVSELMRWVGPVTGIQRVNVSILLERLKVDPNLKLVVYSPIFKKISCIDTVDFLFLFDERRSVELSTFSLRLKYALKKAFESFKNNLPIPIRAPLIRLKRRYSHTRHLMMLALHRALNIERVRHPFRSGDTYLILGNSWGKARITDILAEVKTTKRIKIAHIIFDMIPVVRPDYFERTFTLQYSSEMEKVLKSSDLIFSISQHTTRDVQSFCSLKKIKTPKIATVRLGDDITHLEIKIPIDRLAGQRFVLCVGTIEIRKNHKLLINAWQDLRNTMGDDVPKLVLVGRHGWLVDELISLFQTDHYLKKDVVWLRDISDHQVSWLYQNALFTVYPSLYEGWGLPVAESLALGQICLASNSSSIPEIGGPIVKYFSPFSKVELLEILKTYIAMTDSERSQIRQHIKNQYSPHLWSKTAEAIFTAIGYLHK